jgi:hypothetical protein
MLNAKMGAFLLAGFVAGAFIASPELRAFAANTVGSADIINNSIQSVDIKDGEVKTVDLGGNAVTSAKIKDGEVKAAEIAADAVGASEIAANAVGSSEIALFAVGADEIAPDSVGASELMGVSNLIFAECTVGTLTLNPNVVSTHTCNADGAGPGNVAIAAANGGSSCIAVTRADATGSDHVLVSLGNICEIPASTANIKIGIIVFDTFTNVKPPT